MIRGSVLEALTPPDTNTVHTIRWLGLPREQIYVCVKQQTWKNVCLCVRERYNSKLEVMLQEVHDTICLPPSSVASWGHTTFVSFMKRRKIDQSCRSRKWLTCRQTYSHTEVQVFTFGKALWKSRIFKTLLFGAPNGISSLFFKSSSGRCEILSKLESLKN